jgi:hypothetical protein
MKNLYCWIAIALLLAAGAQQASAQQAPPARPSGDELERWIAHAEGLIPKQAAAYEPSKAKELAAAAKAIEQWGVELTRFDAATTPQTLLATIQRLHDAWQRVDAALERTLALRADFIAIEPQQRRQQSIRNYLAVDTQLIDLTGRLRSILADAINAAAYRFASQPALREQLVDLLLIERSSIGADVMSLALFDPPAETPNKAQPATPELKRKLLKLVAETGEFTLLPRLAEFARSTQTAPPLVVATAETIRQVGLPQDERPNRDTTLPRPPITAAQLHEILAKIPAEQLSREDQSLRDELLAWLAERKEHGLTEDRYRLGRFEVRPGDWLLMRNPSPYNLFTDLSPGLFTHVGLVTIEEGSDGRRRMVIVDLPEEGHVMPATNVEVFLERTLHYFFLRHADAAAANKMGEVARSVIGNPTEFDLNFRTGRVSELKGQPLAGKKICTYCAGLLWLCAQETGLPREEFFPLHEGVAGGRTAENLKKLGMSIGSDFVSPTGALFSPHLSIVGRREAMYDPRREIEEAAFDHFAAGLETRTLTASPDLYQSLRMKLAEAARQNPLLNQALAQAAGVSADLDLVAAARGAAVVETLDEVAYGASGDFGMAMGLLTYGGPMSELVKEATAAEKQQLEMLQVRHRDLIERLKRERVTVRQLRQILLDYYIARGKAQIDERFFAAEKPQPRRRRARS